MTNYIKDLKNNLDLLKDKNLIINQFGFIETSFEIKNFKYTIEYDLLKIFDKQSSNFITININQIYNIIYRKEKIELHLDNDTILLLETKRQTTRLSKLFL